ncbi:MAG: sensor histidine kinase [Acidobacteriota bacterium]
MNDRSAAGLHSPQMLADAFSEFISASATLEASYRDLQREVAHLSIELSERNAELTRSLGENDRMRATLQQMIDSMPCGVLVLDAAETIVTINPEARRLLGRSSARAKTLRDLSSISRIDFEALVTASEGHRDNEVCLTTSGQKRWLAIGRRELQGAAAEGLASIWILRDVTADKLAEQEREHARRATTLAEISTILAHEIRNPLASLELFAGLIAEDRGEIEEWVANLRAGIRTLSGTVNNVLSMNNEGQRRLAPVDLSSCVESGVDFVQPIARQAGVALHFVPADSPVMVEGNEDAIRQVMLNLIANAIRHTSVGGRVQVSAKADTRHGAMRGIVTVRDNGCGIPDAILSHIFEAGFSGTGETPGLGLAVCKRLMAQHRAEIRVQSSIGLGTEFELEFPAI